MNSIEALREIGKLPGWRYNSWSRVSRATIRIQSIRLWRPSRVEVYNTASSVVFSIPLYGPVTSGLIRRINQALGVMTDARLRRDGGVWRFVNASWLQEPRTNQLHCEFCAHPENGQIHIPGTSHPAAMSTSRRVMTWKEVGAWAEWADDQISNHDLAPLSGMCYTNCRRLEDTNYRGTMCGNIKWEMLDINGDLAIPHLPHFLLEAARLAPNRGELLEMLATKLDIGHGTIERREVEPGRFRLPVHRLLSFLLGYHILHHVQELSPSEMKEKYGAE